METADRRSTRSPSKTAKKGGKHVKAPSAEEQERRREAIREKLREKQELERRALQVVERLLDDSVSDDFLLDCARFITAANYKDAIEERSIVKLCGYPVCPNRLGKIPTQQYKISTKTNKVYDITERKCFCSNFCYKASKEFELQISKTPLWLRQHESPPEIKLKKKGDGGSSGEEVLLSQKRLQGSDIENPLAAELEDSHSPNPRSAAARLSHSDSSEDEQEHDCFVSSVVIQQQGPRVHWGNLPKRTDEDETGECGRKLSREGDAEEMQHQKSQKADGGERGRRLTCETEVTTGAAKPQQHAVNTDRHSGEQDLENTRELGMEHRVQEVTTNLNSFSLHTGAHPEGSHTEASPSQPGLDFIQVGMSKRGAAGLRDLLKSHTVEAKPKPGSIRLNLLQYLTTTLKEWVTDETRRFLCGGDLSQDAACADVKEEKEEEELDEDDLEDEVTVEDRGWDDAGEQKMPSAAAAPDYRRLKKETQHLELRIREFYKGTWILPEEKEGLNGDEVTVQDQNTKDPVLPLVDSQAQHLIQKRITVERLSSCLRNIVGPMHLTMSDVTTDLNNLVRTFRFTNTNIIHKTPEWTLIAVVLLHLLSGVSPVIREALEVPSSVEYLNTLMEELSLQKQDLLNLVQLFRNPVH